MTRAGSTSSHTYGLLAALPVRIESHDLEALFYVAPTGWTRHTTVFQLHGSGVTGLGEDVCWNDDEQLHQRQVGPRPGWRLDPGELQLASGDPGPALRAHAEV
jgi:hypothetical protein